MSKQKISTTDLAAVVILVIIGAFYTFAPHEIHVSSGFGFGLEHATHVILGVILLAIGAAYYAKKTGVLGK